MTDAQTVAKTLLPSHVRVLINLQCAGGADHFIRGSTRKALEHRGLITPSKHLTNLGHEVIEHLETA